MEQRANFLANENQQLCNSILTEINEHKEKQRKAELNNQLEEIKLYSMIIPMLKCLYCGNIVNTPVVLPCKHTVCQNHIVDKMTINCILCKQEHAVPNSGFEQNTFLAKFLASDSYLKETERRTKELMEKQTIM